MAIICAGTTDTGNAIDLTEANASAYVIGLGSWEDDIYIQRKVPDFSVIEAPKWNQPGYKEAKIDSNDAILYGSNFVDVYVKSERYDPLIYISSAKRGDIETSYGNDNILLSIKSNKASWDNSFEINTSGGDDNVVITNNTNSKYTSLDIDLGSGDDTLDISGLEPPYNDTVSRTVSGGTGIDKLIYSGNNTVSFSGFEIITGGNNSKIQLTQTLLDNNPSQDSNQNPIIFSDISISLSYSINIDSINQDLTSKQKGLLKKYHFNTRNFISVTVITNNGEYNFLTDDTKLLDL